jgi:serine protease
MIGAVEVGMGVRRVVIVVALVALLAAPGGARAKTVVDDLQAPANHIPGRALLKLKPTTRAASAIVDVDALKALGERTGTVITLRKASVQGWIVVDVREGDGSLPDEERTLALVQRLAADDAVAAASENRWARAFAIPNDQHFQSMWHLAVARLPQAWDDEQGSAAQRVGVVDTGLVRTHEDIGGKAIAGFDFISDPTTAADGTGRDADFQDAGDACGGSGNSFHGTHVAGTIAASTNNGAGIAGVNWNARLSIVRALGRCGGDIVDIMEGATWLAGGQVAGVPAIGADRVTVMNLSHGSRGTCTAFEQDVVNAIDAAGVVFVAAAGNDGGAVNSPANCNNVLSVAAHDRNLARAGYSSFGPQIDIVAPGGDITQNNANGVLSALGPGNNVYAFYQGTSMAAPHVAGVVSLLQAKDPTVNRLKAEQALIQGGQPCSNCAGKPALDAAGALARVIRGGPPTDPVNPVDPVDDAFEDNDGATAARAIDCGATLALQALPRDQDWFFVDVDVGPFAVAIDGGSADLDLYLVRNDNEILLRSETTTGVESIAANVTRAQRLQILINPFANGAVAASGPYTLTLSCTAAVSTPPPVNPTDPGGDPIVPTDPGPEGPDDGKAPVDPLPPGDEGDEVGGNDGDDDLGVGGPGGAPLAVGGCSHDAAANPLWLGLALLLVRRRRRH